MEFIHIAFLSAMPEEVGNTVSNLKKKQIFQYGDLKIYTGELIENDKSLNPILVSVAWSGWGKVSAARAATRLISHVHLNKKIDLILFSGVAGAANNSLNQWDVIVANQMIQHDMDASPLFNKYVIPALNIERLEPSLEYFSWVMSSLRKAKINGDLEKFGIIKDGLIATGDQFVSDSDHIKSLNENIKGILAVEMEGAAVAQVAIQENIPWVIMRVISDNANEEAPENFTQFLEKYKKYSWDILKAILSEIKKFPIKK